MATPNARELTDLVSVGPATRRDLALLGVATVSQLARHEPRALYERLCRVTGVRHDPCCEDVFAAAIAQARDPDLAAEKKQWWYWSRVRKERA
jgi:predicted flap endonuclease-1-like 5' DNA nuclease